MSGRKITLDQVKPEVEKFSFRVWRDAGIFISEAILHVEHGYYHILHNNEKANGTRPSNMCGYEFAVYLGKDPGVVWEYAEDIKILNRKKMNHES